MKQANNFLEKNISVSKGSLILELQDCLYEFLDRVNDENADEVKEEIKKLSHELTDFMIALVDAYKYHSDDWREL